MDMIRTEPQYTQLADLLETRIRNGEYQPGSRLVSSRELCEQFSVSRAVVRSAIEILERKQLVTTSARRGVFVNSKLLSLDKHELCVLSYKNSNAESYLEKALNIHRNADYCRDFNLTLRCFGGSALNCATFRNEVCNAQSAHAELLVLSGSYLDRERLDILDESGVPYLVLGELHHELPDRQFNQIFERFCRKGAFVGDFLARSEFSNIGYLAFPDRMLDYETEYRSLLQERVLVAGKNMELEYFHFDSERETNSPLQVAGALRRMLERGVRPELIHVSESIDCRIFLPILEEFHLVPGRDLFFLIYENTAISHGMPGILEIVPDYSSFSRAVFHRLKLIMEEPEKKLKIDLSDLLKLNIRATRIL